MHADFLSELVKNYPTSDIRKMFVMAADYDKYPAFARRR